MSAKRPLIGILAHVDSGKTTLSEGMLYLSGALRTLGRVDKRDAFLDTHALEKERGITIFSKQAIMRFNDTEFTLLDTPGHVDFSAEAERALKILDYAILVISATDGVQSHTETLWRMLSKYQIPTFIFVNKTDLAGKEKEALLTELGKKLSSACIDFTNREEGKEEFFESLSMCAESLMEEYLEYGEIKDHSISEKIKKRKVFPCYFGSALRLEGVKEFLYDLDLYTLAAPAGENFGASVYKIASDEQGNRLTYMKITGGTLKVKDALSGKDLKGEPWQEKVNQIRIYSGAKFEAAEEAFPGMVCAVTGLSKTYPGEGLGCEKDMEGAMAEAVLNYRVELPEGEDISRVLRAFRILEEEDPQLSAVWNEQLGELHVRLMGQVQLEVLRNILKERFGIEAEFGTGSIVYKETIREAVEGVGHYEPLRHYAEVQLRMEPLPAGSGLQFSTECSEDALDRNWQRLILTHLEEKEHVGVLTGSPITDMRITLTAGRAHLKHTEGGDFRQATYRAVRQGLMRAESVLLEPWYEFTLTVPTDAVGRAMTDISTLGGEMEAPETDGEETRISGRAPVSALRDYHSILIGYTHGKGKLTCRVDGYFPCHNADEVITAIGYDAERDLENTADSVFCSHGAGFTVKWSDAPAHMHLPSSFGKKEETVEEEIPKERVKAYVDRIAEDKELVAIFERTFGPIKRRSFEAMERRREVTPKPYKGKENFLKDGKEYLLVDGYNIIFAWEHLKKQAEESLDLARNTLIHILSNYQGIRGCEVILVFDAYKVKGNLGEVERIGNISVVYTREAETADSYIEKTTHELSRHHRVRVATSDNLEQLIILGSGALRITAETFLDEVKAVEEAIREYLL